MIGLRPAGRLPRFILVALALALPLALAGCFGKTSAESLSCPEAQPVPGLDSIAIFGPGADRSIGNIQVAGKIFSASRQCDEEKGGIRVSMTIAFTAGRNSPEVRRAEFPYFVAVVDFNQTILNEQRFTVPIQFAGPDFRTVQEKITVHLPVERISAGRNFGILVGFQLTPEQVEFNRAQNTGQ